jgi:hypothetical protein
VDGFRADGWLCAVMSAHTITAGHEYTYLTSQTIVQDACTCRPADDDKAASVQPGVKSATELLTQDHLRPTAKMCVDVFEPIWSAIIGSVTEATVFDELSEISSAKTYIVICWLPPPCAFR